MSEPTNLPSLPDLRTRTVQRMAFAGLALLKARGPLQPGDGICSNLIDLVGSVHPQAGSDSLIPPSTYRPWDLITALEVHYPSWSKFTGDLAYPVRYPKPCGPYDTAGMAYDTLPKWEGDYGHLRRELLDHLLLRLDLQIQAHPHRWKPGEPVGSMLGDSWLAFLLHTDRMHAAQTHETKVPYLCATIGSIKLQLGGDPPGKIGAHINHLRMLLEREIGKKGMTLAASASVALGGGGWLGELEARKAVRTLFLDILIMTEIGRLGG